MNSSNSSRREETFLPDAVVVSPGMREVARQVKLLAPFDIPVLIGGESGTGKELVARSIHRESRRAGRPFVALNCAALPDALLEADFRPRARRIHRCGTLPRGSSRRGSGGNAFSRRSGGSQSPRSDDPPVGHPGERVPAIGHQRKPARQLSAIVGDPQASRRGNSAGELS